MSAPVFGRLLTAMVTPMTFDGAVDLRRTGELAHKLVEEQNNDGIVVNARRGNRRPRLILRRLRSLRLSSRLSDRMLRL